jgi:hypothetical protein
VSRATLRLFVNSNHGVGISVHGVATSTWTETTITWANAPAYGPAGPSSGPLTSGTWIELDVTALVSGGGPVSLALTTTSSTAVSLASRETGANAAQLVIESP